MASTSALEEQVAQLVRDFNAWLFSEMCAITPTSYYDIVPGEVAAIAHFRSIEEDQNFDSGGPMHVIRVEILIMEAFSTEMEANMWGMANKIKLKDRIERFFACAPQTYGILWGSSVANDITSSLRQDLKEPPEAGDVILATTNPGPAVTGVPPSSTWTVDLTCEAFLKIALVNNLAQGNLTTVFDNPPPP